mmetsp:Transcript_37519/g.65843  ORF Transcript_37519/g.65843 Transcript_37519/m.65843 type:complete len:86 (+) Transcript_37519:1282-1539(+)
MKEMDSAEETIAYKVSAHITMAIPAMRGIGRAVKSVRMTSIRMTTLRRPPLNSCLGPSGGTTLTIMCALISILQTFHFLHVPSAE